LGNEKWARVMGQADFLNGKCVRIYGSFQDITDRKMSEFQIEEQIKALAKSNQELEQFAYVASHDLQEPLRMVTSFLALIEKKYGPLFDTKGKTYIEYAMDGAVRMRRIILDLLDFSRVGRNEEAPVKIDLMAVIEDVKKLQKQAIEENHAIIETDNLPQVIATKLSVEQVFNNLIGNALKYRKPDINPEIKISANDIGKFWEIAVSDNGIGIEKEYFDKVFIIFQRLHTKEEYSGTGIGLAIVKKIIDNLGGKIWLESEVGKGSTFYFTLPK
jgi:light-regulated signal transduction histidine kinase (bacteriophytochrome)